jgi:hypothetical protein
MLISFCKTCEYFAAQGMKYFVLQKCGIEITVVSRKVKHHVLESPSRNIRILDYPSVSWHLSSPCSKAKHDAR